MKKTLIVTLLLLSLIQLGYLGYRYVNRTTKIAQSENEFKNEDKQEPIPTPTPKPEKIIYEETPASQGETYFEKVVKIKGQYAYIAYPIEILKDAPPTLIVFSHGSNTTITNNLKDPFMKDMQLYGKYFAKRGYAFSASNMHGANYGNALSLDDIDNMIEWIKGKYLIEDKINMIGFSMGGYPTLNYALKYPKNINRIALLAPALKVYTKTQYESIKNIPIQIWHGNKDVNVPSSVSSNFFTQSQKYQFKNVRLNILTNKAHFDIDTEQIKDIFTFFKD